VKNCLHLMSNNDLCVMTLSLHLWNSVGWQYVGVCYDVHDTDDYSLTSGCDDLLRCRRKLGVGLRQSKTRVDFSLIHDIVPQRGGDFEPLDSDE